MADAPGAQVEHAWISAAERWWVTLAASGCGRHGDGRETVCEAGEQIATVAGGEKGNA